MRLRVVSSGSRAFTLTELLITLGLLGMIAVIAVPVVSNMQVSSQLDDVTTEIKMALHTARTRSVARAGNASHGLLFVLTPGAQSYTLYQAPVATGIRDPALDEIRTVPRSITIATSLPSATIHFSAGLGTPGIATLQTITITHTSGVSRVITITPAGLVDAE